MKSYIKSGLILAAAFISASSTYAQSSPPCTDSSRECVVSAASSYLQALLTRDGSAVPLADDAKRWENGVVTGDSGKAIRESFADYGQKAPYAMRDVRWIVDGNQAMVFYLLDVALPYTTVHAATTRIAERFLVENGLIKEIEVLFCNSPGIKPEEREVKSTTPLSFICTRLI